MQKYEDTKKDLPEFKKFKSGSNTQKSKKEVKPKAEIKKVQHDKRKSSDSSNNRSNF